MSAAGTSTGVLPGDSQTVTVTLPRMEDFAEDSARAGRMMQAADLAVELTPEGFSRWMELGKAIKAQENEKAPSVEAGKHNTQGA